VLAWPWKQALILIRFTSEGDGTRTRNHRIDSRLLSFAALVLSLLPYGTSGKWVATRDCLTFSYSTQKSLISQWIVYRILYQLRVPDQESAGRKCLSRKAAVPGGTRRIIGSRDCRSQSATQSSQRFVVWLVLIRTAPRRDPAHPTQRGPEIHSYTWLSAACFAASEAAAVPSPRIFGLGSQTAVTDVAGWVGRKFEKAAHVWLAFWPMCHVFKQKNLTSLRL
jgi:hypothetical protein